MVRNLWVSCGFIYSIDFCNSWDEMMLVSLVNHVLEEAKQKIKVAAEKQNNSEATHRESESKKSPHKENDTSIEKDLMDYIPSNLEK